MTTETELDIVTGSDGKQHDLAKAKIPQWLRDYIGELRDERDQAQREAEQELDGDTWRDSIAALWEDIGNGRLRAGNTDGSFRAYRAADNIRGVI